MTHDEYQNAIAELMKGGDGAADAGAALLKAIDDDAAAAAAAAAEKDAKTAEDAKTIEDLNKKINDYKVKEFMAKTGKPEKHTPAEEAAKILAGIIDPHTEKGDK